MNAASRSSHPSSITAEIALAIEDGAIAIGRLDSRISGSSVRSAWSLRAAWTGYARALQLQGVEIDEIDLFSWGCGLTLPHRTARPSTLSEFEGFASWRATFAAPDRTPWRDRLPFPPSIAPGKPALLRAVDVVHQYARHDGGAAPWLALPDIMRGLGLTDTPLPCLVGGAKAFRRYAVPPDDVVCATLRSLAAAARTGLERLDAIEGAHRRAMAAILSERRPGALPRLAALALHNPLLSPQAVSRHLGLSLAGAGKLLGRAAELGLLIEVSGRQTWRTYLAPDLAVMFGYAAPPRGRPAKATLVEPSRELSDTLDAFDREMLAIDEQLRTLGVATGA